MGKRVLPSDITMVENDRIYALDTARGICVILMVCYHMFYTVGYIFGFGWAKSMFDFFTPIEPLFAGIFILICGISCQLSKSNLKRGLKLGALAIVLTIVTYLISRYANLPDTGDIVIWFGILHLLAVCILLFALIKKVFNVIHPIFGVILVLIPLMLLFRINSGIIGIGSFVIELPHSLYESYILYPLGLSKPLASGDYFPILPWIFVFFAGCFLGVFFKKRQVPDGFYTDYFPKIGGIGRNALIIYVIHQPAIYAVTWLIVQLMKILGKG